LAEEEAQQPQGQNQLLLHILQRLVQEMHGQVSEAWINNVGNNIGFCSGPVPFLTSLGVIGAAQGNSSLVLGKGREAEETSQDARRDRKVSCKDRPSIADG
jgi:hypothetical protein